MPSTGPLFDFFAGVSVAGEDIRPEHLLVDGAVQVELSELFQSQAEEFLKDDSDRIEFDSKAIYRLERGQVFVIKNIELPTAFFEAAMKPHQVDPFALNRKPLPMVATIFATETSGKSVSRVLFQQFRTPQLLDKKFAIFWSGSVFSRIANDGLSLAHELAAIWVGRNLYFRSFPAVSRFFDLAEFEPKATVAEISAFVGSDVFVQDDDTKHVFALIEGDDFLRRRVASIQSKNILNAVKPRTAATKAKAFDIKIDVKRPDSKKDRIALPTVKKELKSVVKFLNEEYFHGELTEERYETNSLRRLPT